MFAFIVLLGILILVSEFVKKIRLISQPYIPLFNLIVGFALAFAYGNQNILASVMIAILLTGISIGVQKMLERLAG